jgi:hypothetical protein
MVFLGVSQHQSAAPRVLLSLTYTEAPLRFHKAPGKAPKAG